MVTTVPGWLLLLVGVLAVLTSAYELRTAYAEQAASAAELAAASPAAEASTTAAADQLDPRAQKAAAGILQDLEVPWARLFAALEAARQRDIALLGLEPSPARQEIRITAEAGSAQTMFDYIEGLRRDQFPQASLSSHEVQTQVPGSPIRFVLVAPWKSR
jgi:hypothetical protein